MSQNSFTKEEQSVLNSIKVSRIILPILIGLGVVFYLIWKQWNPEIINQIEWGTFTLFWLGAAILLYVIRHLFYAWRLRILSDGVFSWLKSIELVFLWEFSTAVSPTSVGGSTVALFFLAQEKLSAAKTVSVVVYTMIVDTLFFLISLPVLYFLIGPLVLRPHAQTFADLEGFGIGFWSVIIFMATYGTIFFWGIFIRPQGLKKLLLWLSKFKWLKRFRESIQKTANDVVTTSTELRSKPWSYHVNVMVSSTGAWVTRFMAINCIIIALVKNLPLDFWNQFILYGRGKAMHSLVQFSPTPGGSGVTELMFEGFYSDYIPAGLAIIVALIWRLVTYYPYLIAGAIIIPNWLRKIVNNRRSSM